MVKLTAMAVEGTSGGSRQELSITILGPVSAWRGGVELALPAGRPSVVLAVLALRPGSVVGLDVLEEYLWPDQPPERPRSTIQTHVARLRHVVGRDTIRAVAGGYVLDVAPDAVDLGAFRALVSAAAATAEPRNELDLLNRALSLWRGAPLSGLTPDHVERERATAIVEELLNATERANELRLQLGHLDGLQRSLRALVAAHPWRERTWAQLMLTLYRQGRRSEALAAFHDVGHVLRDELGIDPGSELVTLHRRILENDSTLLEPETSPARPYTRPAQLPPPVPDFIGREQQVEHLVDVLTGPAAATRVVLISGPGGSGKSTLAIHVAHRVREHYPDGQLVAELRGPHGRTEHGDVLGRLLRSLGVAAAEVPADVAERASLFRTLCDGQRLLLILDDAHIADDLPRLIPGGEMCGVIVTSRPPLTNVPAAARVDLGFFGEADSGRLLTSIVGAERTSSDPESAAAISAACEGSPLALRIAGGRIAARPTWPLAHFAQRLTAGNRLDELAMGGLGVRAMLEASHDDLEPQTAQRLRLLAAAPIPAIDVEFAAVAWDVDDDDAQASLEALADVRLIEPTGPGHYTWHDLVNDYLNDDGDPADQAAVAAATRRLMRYYLRSLDNAKYVFRPGGTNRDTSSWYPHDVAGRTFESQVAVHTWLHPRHHLIAGLARRVLTTPGTPDSADAAQAAALMLLLGSVAYECCDDREHLENTARAVLAAEEQLSDRFFVSAAWHSVSLALSEEMRIDESLEAAARALAIRREIGDRFGEVTLLNNMAMLHQHAGRHHEAAELLERCVTTEDPLPPEVRACCLRNLGEVQLSLGRLDDARRSLQAAVATCPPEPVSRDAFYQAAAEASLYLQCGDHDAAFASCTEAAAVAEKLGASSLQAVAWVQHGRIHAAVGATADAVRLWRDAMAVPAGLDDATAAEVRRLIAEATGCGAS